MKHILTLLIFVVACSAPEFQSDVAPTNASPNPNTAPLNGNQSRHTGPKQIYIPYTPMPVPQIPYNPIGTSTPSPSSPTLPSTSSPLPTINYPKVDGQEVVNDCNQCVTRAQTLSQTIGFYATKANARNLGFYKIDPVHNLCDIHFFKNMSIPLDDHSGKDTIGNNQNILYCPCNCGWTEYRNDIMSFPYIY